MYGWFLENMTVILVWGIIFIVALVIEIETVNLTTIWFCISSILALIVGIFGANIYWQVGVFLIGSALLLAITKPFVKKFSKKEPTKTNVYSLLGQVAFVTSKITADEYGEVRLGANIWRAINKEGLTIDVGEKVIVKEIEGVKLIVLKLNENEEDRNV